EDLSTRESCVVRPRRAEAPPRLNLGPEQNKRPGPGWIDCSPYCFGLRRGGCRAIFWFSTGTRKKQAGEAGGFCTAAPMRRRANQHKEALRCRCASTTKHPISRPRR